MTADGYSNNLERDKLAGETITLKVVFMVDLSSFHSYFEISTDLPMLSLNTILR